MRISATWMSTANPSGGLFVEDNPMTMQIEATRFGRWQQAYRLRLGVAEMIVVTEIGPRILSLTVGDSPNLLFVDEGLEIARGAGNDPWRIYGGHRIWMAPETEDAYAPDNVPCQVTVGTDGLTALAPVSPRTLLQKRLTVRARDGRFVVEQGVRNLAETVYCGAVWALTCVVPKGVVAFPWGAGGGWDVKKIMYWNRWMDHRSDVASVQWQPGPDLFRVLPTGEEGKVGTNAPEGWVALCRDDATFIKSRVWAPGVDYPDDGCSLEVYTSPKFIELETLGPITTLYPGQEITHEETWTATSQVVDSEDGAALRALLI